MNIRKVRQALPRRMPSEDIWRVGGPELCRFSPCPVDYVGPGIYIIEFKDGIKVGISTCIKERIAYYARPWNQSMGRVRCYKAANPRVIETFIKQRFSKLTKKGSSEYLYGDRFELVVAFLERNRFFFRPK
jgi:hypothetical protein